jgi:hypothetical protein
MPDGFATTPEPLYDAVIFTSQRTLTSRNYVGAAMTYARLHLTQNHDSPRRDSATHGVASSHIRRRFAIVSSDQPRLSSGRHRRPG